MKQANLPEVYGIIKRISKLFAGRCYVCRRKCQTGKYFTVHHKKYLPTDKIHSDFESRLDYYRYLEPLIIEDRKTHSIEDSRFAFVCNPNHQALERLKRYKPENRKRLLHLLKQSI